MLKERYVNKPVYALAVLPFSWLAAAVIRRLLRQARTRLASWGSLADYPHPGVELLRRMRNEKPHRFDGQVRINSFFPPYPPAPSCTVRSTAVARCITATVPCPARTKWKR